MAVAMQPDARPMPPGPWSAGEWQVRCDLAAACRLFQQLGWDDLVYTHLSARVPGDAARFLINPYDLMFDEVTASSLVAVDPEGQPLEPGALNPAGFTIHAGIYAARPDVLAVVHLHSPAGSVVSTLAEGLLPLHQFSMQFHDRIAYHSYEGLALDAAEGDRLATDLGTRWAMILRNHGLLTAGRSVSEAFTLLYYLEQACRIQAAALATGRPLVLPSPEICERTARQYEEDGQPGAREGPALLRRLARAGIDYAR